MTRKRDVQKYLRRSDPKYQKKYRIVSARFKTGVGDRQHLTEPHLGVIYDDEPENWYHGPGPTHMINNGEILKEYPTTGDDLYEDWDKAIVSFYNDNPIIPEYKVSAGWLSPEGDFYPCRYAEHDYYAGKIGAVVYKEKTSTVDFEKGGWVRVNDDGNACFGWRTDFKYFTSAQTETLSIIREMARQRGNEDFLSNLEVSLELRGNTSNQVYS